MHPKHHFTGRQLHHDEGIAFISMPFDPSFDKVYDTIRRALEDADRGLRCDRTDKIFSDQTISARVLAGIETAEFIVADITKNNANVLYELGIAHVLGKKCILITQAISEVPFDLQDHQCLQYEGSAGGLEELRGKLSGLVRTLREDPKVTYDVKVLSRKQVISIERQLCRAKTTVHFLTSTGREIPLQLLENRARDVKLTSELLVLDPKSAAAGVWFDSYQRSREQEIIETVVRASGIPNTKIRLSRAYISSSMLGVDIDDSENGLIVVNFHTFGDSTKERPFLELYPESPWYKLFRSQFRKLWGKQGDLRMRLSAKGMREIKAGVFLFPFSVRESRGWGVLIDDDFLADLFFDLGKKHAVVHPTTPLDHRWRRVFRDLPRPPENLEELTRLHLWPGVYESDEKAILAAASLVEQHDYKSLLAGDLPLLSLEQLELDFGTGASTTMLRFPELLSCLEKSGYRAPVPFFIADAERLPSSLAPENFRQSRDLPREWASTPCISCGRHGRELRFYVGPQRLVRCIHCNLEMADPQPHGLDQQRSFEKYGVDAPRKESMKSKGRGYAQVLIDDLMRFGFSAPRSLVEFGSASGELLYSLVTDHDWPEDDLLGIDICEASVRSANGRGRPQTIRENIEEMSTDKYRGKFSYAVIVNTIEHFADPLLVLKKAKEMLSGDGKVFVVNVPNSSSVHSTLFPEGFISRNFADGQHFYHFDPDSFEKLCLKAELNVLELLGKRKEIVHGRDSAAAIWIAHQCGIDVGRLGIDRFPEIVGELRHKLQQYGDPELNEAFDAHAIDGPADLVSFWRTHVWSSFRRSDCFDAWLTC